MTTRHHRHRASATSRSTCSTRAPRRRPRTSSSSPTKGFYDDVIFHRVIPGFVAQAGDGQYGKKSALERGRVGTGGPGYKFEDEPVQGDYVRGALAMANAGPEHERQPVLHLPPGPDRQAAQELHAVRPGDPRAWTSSTRSSGAPRDGRDFPDEPVAMTSVTIHAGRKVKEFTPRVVSKPLENGPRRGRISVLLSQPLPQRQGHG